MRVEVVWDAVLGRERYRVTVTRAGVFWGTTGTTAPIGVASHAVGVLAASVIRRVDAALDVGQVAGGNQMVLAQP